MKPRKLPSSRYSAEARPNEHSHHFEPFHRATTVSSLHQPPLWLTVLCEIGGYQKCSSLLLVVCIKSLVERMVGSGRRQAAAAAAYARMQPLSIILHIRNSVQYKVQCPMSLNDRLSYHTVSYGQTMASNIDMKCLSGCFP